MERKNIDENISLLFWRLIKITPALIKDRKLFYNFNGDLVKIWWRARTEKDLKRSSCPEYNKEVFTRDLPESSFVYWEVDNSRQLDGYTFYIDTPVCQFKVPELSRSELCEAQDLIEKHFENFIPRYLDSLLNIPKDYYGKVSVKEKYSNVVAY